MQSNGLNLSQNVNIFKLNNMVLLCKILETEKRKRPMKHYVSLIWLIKYFYFFTWQRFVFYLFRNILFFVYPCSFFLLFFVILFLLLL